MSLILSKSPAGTAEVVTQAVQRAHRAKFSRRSALGGGTPAVVTPVAPLPVYLLGLKQVTNSLGLASARSVGWQSLILQGKNPVAAVDFDSDTSGNASKSKSYSQGAQVGSVAAALAVAEALPQVAAANYEPRLLQAPAINLLALWLHGAQDVLIPLDPAPGTFKPYVTYEPKLFFELAAKLATHHLFDDRPQPLAGEKPDLTQNPDHNPDDEEPPLSAAG
ncbi:MAG TPA: hypothetical protein VGO57_15295 [Verrucomicrobiae bacterium]|jgi:hypothetical protein